MNTMQQEFDAVVAHLYKQGRPALIRNNIDGPACMYRTPGENPLSCAVGCRIPDAVYDPAMDKEVDSSGTSVGTLIKRFGPSLPAEITAYERLFSNLQSAHDGCNTHADGTFKLDYLNARLDEIAEKHGLTFTQPQ